MRAGQRFLTYYLPPILALTFLLIIWQLYVDVNNLRPSVLPSPTRVVTALWDSWDVIWENALQTLIQTVIGFTIALVSGFGLAVLLDLSWWVRRAIYPLLVASQTIPIVAIAPLLLVWFGFDILPKLIIVWLVCFFPITVGGVDGFATTDREAERLLKSMGATKWQMFWYLRLPSALPGFFSGIRIAVTYSVAGSVIAEYVGAEKGLGIFIQRAKNSFRNDLIFSAVLVTAVLSVALFSLVSLVQRWVMPYYFMMKEKTTKSG
jgi:ABC-type nitrate/sulfonate/bicarbonate transport system permease component